MSKLQQLLQELCPNGVDFKRLGECCHLEKGNTPIQKAVSGEYPLVVTTEKRKTSNTYQFDIPTVCIPLVSSRGHGVASLNQVYYQDGKFALGNILCGVTPIDNTKLSARFLYYYLNYKKDILLVPLMNGGANVSLTVDSLRRVKVPVPPIEVQNKIVSILDSFIALLTELKAEQTARKKQYEYYRDMLLTFHSDCVWRTLGDFCDLLTGYPFDSSQFKKDGIRLLRGMNIKRGVLEFNEDINKYWTDSAGLERFFLNAGDIVIAMDGSLVGKSYGIVMESDLPLLLVQRVTRIRTSKANIRYVYHYIASGAFTNYVKKKKSPGAIPHISLKDISNFAIPLPSLSVQQRIVNILDRFDAICNDLTSGIPAEIEARQKQYEYYRDMLLTFPTANG